MICPKCGGNILPQDDGMLVCRGCGTKFVKKAQKSTPSNDGANHASREEDVQNLKMRLAQMEQKQAELERELAKTKKASLQNGALGAGKSGFTATVFELFAEKLLLLWVSLVTLGIAYPWLKCHYEGFIASKTYVKGHRLSFDGKGKDLAKKYFLWMLLSVVTFGVYSIFVADKMHKWVIEHTHYDANCGGQSSYDGKAGAIFGYKLAVFFAGLFTFGIAKPFVECKREDYLCEHTLIDGSQLRFDGSGGELLEKQVLWVALTIATFGVYAIWLNLQKQQWICACLSSDDLVFSVDETSRFYDEESARLAEEKRQQQEQERQKQEQERQQRLLEKQRKKQQLSEMRNSPKGKASSALFALSVICFAGAFCIMAPTLAMGVWVGLSVKLQVAALIMLSCAAVAMLAGCIACSAKIKRRALAIVSIVLIVLSVGTMSSGIFVVTQIEKYKTTDPFFYTLQDDGTYEVSLNGSHMDRRNVIESKRECANKLEGNLVIPSSHEGIPVTAIGNFEFNTSGYSVDEGDRMNNEFKNRITSITIPDSIKTIGSNAFNGFNSITEITIPNGVTRIGEGAFSGCSSLESITIPFVGAKAGVTSSDTYQYPFGYIFGTSSYTGGVATKQYYFGSSTSDTSDSTYYIPSSLKSVTVTGGNILRGAFQNCTELTSVTIPDSLTSMGSHAFYNCAGLTSITIPNGLTSIDYGTFYNCTELTSIIIPDSVTRIDTAAFNNCTELVNITIPDSVASMGYGAFYNTAWYNNQPDGLIYAGNVAYGYKGTMPANTTITIKDGTLGIADYAFAEYSDLTSITIPDSVTNIGEYVFGECTGLTSVTIGRGVASIGEGAFYGCTWLTKLYFYGTEEKLNSITTESFYEDVLMAEIIFL